MDSELAILKARHGFQPKPSTVTPAPEEAVAASRAYKSVLREFESERNRIRTYVGYGRSADLSLAVEGLIDNATSLAGKLVSLATALNRFPSCFMNVESGVAYYRDIAGAANEAYENRLAELDELTIKFGSAASPAKSPEILRDHEGFKGGHVIGKHVDKTMADFQLRFLQENKERLSSLMGDRADEVVERAVTLNEALINRASEGEKLYIPIDEITPIGYVKERNFAPQFTKRGRLIIFKDSSHPSGYRILSVELGPGEKA
jgi:hypothetical protein